MFLSPFSAYVRVLICILSKTAATLINLDRKLYRLDCDLHSVIIFYPIRASGLYKALVCFAYVQLDTYMRHTVDANYTMGHTRFRLPFYFGIWSIIQWSEWSNKIRLGECESGGKWKEIESSHIYGSKPNWLSGQMSAPSPQSPQGCGFDTWL